MKDKPPADFNWVKARHDCSLLAAFRHLEASAQKDVEQRNELRDHAREMFVFKYVKNTGDTFYVTREGGRDPRLVSFSLLADCISVQDTNGNRMFIATLTLNDYGECMFSVDGEEFYEWQLLRKAVEPIFF